MKINPNTVAATLVGLAYAAAVVLSLPSSTFLHMLGGFAGIIALLFAVSSFLGRRPMASTSILAVVVASAFILVVPHFPAMGGTHRAAVPIGFLGSQAAALTWITLRWRSTTPSGGRVDLRSAVTYGVYGALFLSAIATIPIVIGLITGETGWSSLLLVYPAYFVGLIGAAFVYWALQSMAHHPAGQYLIGALCGLCLYAAIGPVVLLFRNEPIVLQEILIGGAVCGFLVGPPVAMAIADA